MTRPPTRPQHTRHASTTSPQVRALNRAGSGPWSARIIGTTHLPSVAPERLPRVSELRVQRDSCAVELLLRVSAEDDYGAGPVCAGAEYLPDKMHD